MHPSPEIRGPTVPSWSGQGSPCESLTTLACTIRPVIKGVDAAHPRDSFLGPSVGNMRCGEVHARWRPPATFTRKPSASPRYVTARAALAALVLMRALLPKPTATGVPPGSRPCWRHFFMKLHSGGRGARERHLYLCGIQGLCAAAYRTRDAIGTAQASDTVATARNVWLSRCATRFASHSMACSGDSIGVGDAGITARQGYGSTCVYSPRMLSQGWGGGLAVFGTDNGILTQLFIVRWVRRSKTHNRT